MCPGVHPAPALVPALPKHRWLHSRSPGLAPGALRSRLVSGWGPSSGPPIPALNEHRGHQASRKGLAGGLSLLAMVTTVPTQTRPHRSGSQMPASTTASAFLPQHMPREGRRARPPTGPGHESAWAGSVWSEPGWPRTASACPPPLSSEVSCGGWDQRAAAGKFALPPPVWDPLWLPSARRIRILRSPSSLLRAAEPRPSPAPSAWTSLLSRGSGTNAVTSDLLVASCLFFCLLSHLPPTPRHFCNLPSFPCGLICSCTVSPASRDVPCRVQRSRAPHILEQSLPSDGAQARGASARSNSSVFILQPAIANL